MQTAARVELTPYCAAVPKPRPSGSIRMESSPYWENWACIQKRSLTPRKKKLLWCFLVALPLLPSTDPNQTASQTLTNTGQFPVPVLVLMEGDPVADLMFLLNLTGVLVRYSQRWKKWISKQMKKRKIEEDKTWRWYLWWCQPSLALRGPPCGAHTGWLCTRWWQRGQRWWSSEHQQPPYGSARQNPSLHLWPWPGRPGRPRPWPTRTTESCPRTHRWWWNWSQPASPPLGYDGTSKVGYRSNKSNVKTSTFLSFPGPLTDQDQDFKNTKLSPSDTSRED